MSINIYYDKIEIFKFQSSGLVALCQEVTDYVNSGAAEEDGAIIETAHFVQGKHSLSVIFYRQK